MREGRRLFIGVMAKPATLEAIAECRAAWLWPPHARLVSLADAHLTLHFLGTVSCVDEHRLRGDLARVHLIPTRLHLVRAEVWPSGVAVLRPNEDESMRRLHADLAEVLSRLGLPVEERPWKPHVTLARDAFSATIPPLPICIPWDVCDFSLVWSRGGRGPSKYEVVASWPTASRASSSMAP